jgi:hypothetical protein
MKRNSLVVLGLSAVLGFGLFGIGCSDDSKPANTDGSTDAKSDAVSFADAKGTGGAGGATGAGGAIDAGGGVSTGGVTGAGGSPSTGGVTGAGGSTAVLDGGHDSSPDLKGIDGSNVDGADAPINNDLPPVIVDGGVDAPDTSITPVDTGIDIGALDSQGIDGEGIDGGIDGGID